MKKIVPLLIIFGLCFFAIQPLFHAGFFTMHDDEQIARLFDLNNSLLAWQIPPRWVSHLGFGYGYPLFNFYPPFVYYLGEFFYLVGFSLINSTKIVMALGYLLSALFMYLWVKNRYGIIAGIVAAVLYTYAPYHSVDLYVRGSLSEFFCFVWIPAVFWAFDLLFTKKRLLWAVVAGACLSFVVLTHSLSALAFLPFLCIYVAYLFYENRQEVRQIFPLACFAGFIGLGLSAYFWLPSLTEKKYTLVDQVLTKELADYTIHFVYIRQFWNSAWGYGASVAGPWDGLSFQIGKIHIILSLLSLLGVAIVFLRKKLKISFVFPVVMFCMFLFSTYMATKYSGWIWARVQPFWYIQFPWRFLLFTVAFASLLGGFCIKILQVYLPKVVVYGISILIIAGSIFAMVNNLHPDKYIAVTDAFYTTHNDIEWRVSNLSYEYLPKGVATKLSPAKTTVISISKSDIPKQPYTVLSGLMQVSVLENKPQIKQFRITAQKKGVLQINTFSFPGWQVLIDGEKITYSDNNRLKLITFPIPDGTHTITVNFGNTFSRSLANMITLITIFVLFACLIIFFTKKYKKRM